MLGKIINIDNDIVRVKLGVSIYEVDNMFGKYVIFDNLIVGIVNGIDIENIDVRLVGNLTNGIFMYGCMVKPNFSSDVRLITKNELDNIYSINVNDNYLKLGYNYFYNDYVVNMNVNSFFANHFAILGNTGSGKSYSVAKIIQSIFYDAKYLPFKTNIFLFDAYGEYQSAFENIGSINQNINYKVYTTDFSNNDYDKLYIPFWFLTVDDICLLLGVDELKQIPVIEKALKYVYYFSVGSETSLKYKNDIIARCLIDVIFSVKNSSEVRNRITSIITKFYTKDINLDTKLTKGGWTRSLRQCIFVEETGRFADIEIVIEYLEKFCLSELPLVMPNGSFKYSMQEFYNSLEFTLMSEGIFNSDKVYDYANILKIRLNALLNSEYARYFECNEYLDRDRYVKLLLTSRSGNKAQVINFNINYVDDRFAKNLVKIYSRILFEYIAKFSPRASLPFHIVLEEAHRYVQNDNDVKILGYNIFDRIAKEGRKYGIILGLISQRPYEISETAISQCSNFLVFKMFHPKDLAFIGDIIPDVGDDEITRIKNLNPGVCMIFGNAFKIPTMVKMDKPNPEPTSRSCDINNTWYIKNKN